jgi:hypothetical protein
VQSAQQFVARLSREDQLECPLDLPTELFRLAEGLVPFSDRSEELAGIDPVVFPQFATQRAQPLALTFIVCHGSLIRWRKEVGARGERRRAGSEDRVERGSLILMRRAELVDNSERSAGGQAPRHGNDALGMHGGTLRWKAEKSIGIAVGEKFSTSYGQRTVEKGGLVPVQIGNARHVLRCEVPVPVFQPAISDTGNRRKVRADSRRTTGPGTPRWPNPDDADKGGKTTIDKCSFCGAGRKPEFRLARSTSTAERRVLAQGRAPPGVWRFKSVKQFNVRPIRNWVTPASRMWFQAAREKQCGLLFPAIPALCPRGSRSRVGLATVEVEQFPISCVHAAEQLPVACIKKSVLPVSPRPIGSCNFPR